MAELSLPCTCVQKPGMIKLDLAGRAMILKDIYKHLRHGRSQAMIFESIDGVTVIPLCGSEKDLFSFFNSKLPNMEALDYLRTASSNINNINKTCKLKIKIDEGLDSKSVGQRYRDFIAFQILDKSRKELKLNITALILIIIGSMVLGLSYIFTGYLKLFADTINIFGWVIVWEAADILVFKRPDLMKEIVCDLRLHDADWD